MCRFTCPACRRSPASPWHVDDPLSEHDAESDPHHTVTVVVRRGLVAVVQNLPPGYGYEVIDLDECP